MAENHKRKNRDIRNKRREKQKLRDIARRKVSDDWEDYANRELLDIGQDYDYIEYDDDEIHSKDYR
jgi:hypothetical protein